MLEKPASTLPYDLHPKPASLNITELSLFWQFPSLLWSMVQGYFFLGEGTNYFLKTL